MSKRTDEREPYTMPRPRKPMVNWYRMGDRRDEACIALVTNVDESCVDVAVLYPGDKMFQVKFACRHVDDPDVTIEDRQDSGGWDEMPEATEDSVVGKTLRMLTTEVTELRKRVAELEGARRRKGPPEGETIG
ncbi:MAG TPA: hypothetical protein VM243_11945 [Phycisphaerae bacterium]|nr:hypothetical protein [Phycisphaerae bacterium]